MNKQTKERGKVEEREGDNGEGELGLDFGRKWMLTVKGRALERRESAQ